MQPVENLYFQCWSQNIANRAFLLVVAGHSDDGGMGMEWVLVVEMEAVSVATAV